MKHDTTIDRTPSGHLGRCETCGDRNTEFTGYGPALDWCDKHERRGSAVMHKGAGSLRALARLYRDRSTLITYNATEREQWKMLAEEMEAEITARNTTVLPGQMALYEDDSEGERA